jgi:diguanylate cyclase (GGDEF)-like protein
MLGGQQRILEMVVRHESVTDTLTAIARFAEQCMPQMMVSILVWSPAEARLRRGGRGRLPASFADLLDGLEPSLRHGSCGACAHLRSRVVSVDVDTDIVWSGLLDACRAHGIRSSWSSPLISSRGGALLGVFGMYSATPGLPSDADLQIAEALTSLATIALERSRDDESRSHRALHDSLTGLGNRTLLNHSGPGLVASARRTGEPLTLAFIDLDGFKSYNDSYGHVRGDELLQDIAAVMVTVLGERPLLVRTGGDEFVALLHADLPHAEQRLEQLRQALANDIRIGDVGVPVRFSCGVAAVGPDATDLDALVYFADEAARRAKSRGGDRVVVVGTIELSDYLRRRDSIGILTNAVSAGSFIPHLQPVVALTTRRPIAFELLLRTDDPRLAHVPIHEWISIAEETGLIHEIGMYMLRTATQLLADQAEDLRGVNLNVNLSVRQLTRRHFLDEVAALLAETGVDPHRICLEITESLWLDTDGPARDTVRALKAMGFLLALDDFGTGYASLGYLRELDFDTVKVDRSFVQGVHLDGNDRSMCDVMLAMCQVCDLGVVAEGVETEEQARALAELGFEAAQGFLFGEPMPVAAALAWLAAAPGTPVVAAG